MTWPKHLKLSIDIKHFNSPIILILIDRMLMQSFAMNCVRMNMFGSERATLNIYHLLSIVSPFPFLTIGVIVSKNRKTENTLISKYHNILKKYLTILFFR